ncbi:hypothetical protein BpHYR1_006342 [Brachionus plicatilis]|uniref:Uncharacterized protein n=1 Tax=Brachionus plicatilis TaxID=10195 RepID=A0A3M7RI98_BRAPC|nr:hypothetical protein BpHYR1_006342 [Brachionus plicatilis]
MLKNLCFCSGQHCTTSTASLKVNSNLIKNKIEKPEILVSSEEKFGKSENSSSERSDTTDNSKSSDESNSLTNSYPSTLSNSIHFYHPKSIQSTHFTEMSSGKKISSFNYLSSNETSEVTLFSSVPSNTFSQKPSIENNNEKIKKLISLTKKRLSAGQSTAILQQGSIETNPSMQEIKLLKKINSYQFSMLKNKFNKSVKKQDESTERLIRRPSSETKTDFSKSNNVDIYESINLSNNHIDSNTMTVSKKNNTADFTEEFQKDSLNSEEVSNINQESNETGISLDSFDKITTSESTKNSEAAPFIHETYNNIISGNEITYVSNNKRILANNCSSNYKRSEFYIKIEGINAKVENKQENFEAIKTKNLKRIKKPETKKRVKVELKKDKDVKNIEIPVKHTVEMSKIEDSNLKTRVTTKQRHQCISHKKVTNN